MKIKILLAAAMTALAFSCSEKPEEDKTLEPSYQPQNRIWYCGQILDIKSAVHTEENGAYTFYLSPTSGITDAEEMISKGNCMTINLGSLSGYKSSFEISYRDILVDAASAAANKAFSFELEFSDGDLSVYIWIVNNDGKELVAGYSGAAPESVTEPVHLVNQFAIGRTISDIGSALDWRTAGKSRTYYLHSATGITTPGASQPADLEITIPEDCYGKQIDLSEEENIVIRCSGEDIAAGGRLTGTLFASAGRLGAALGLSLDAQANGKSVKAEYSGNTVSGYFSDDTFEFKDQDKTTACHLGKMFGYRGSGSITFAFGYSEKEISRPEDLRGDEASPSGYAVRLTITSKQIGSEVEVGPGSAAASVFVYDYANARTYSLKKEEIVSGSILAMDDMPDGRIYLKVSLTLLDGQTVSAEYFGNVTMMDEDIDISPILPETSAIIVTNKDEKELLNMEITSLQIRKTESYTSSFGETVSAYVLYFINAKSAEDPHDDSCTPRLAIKDDAFGLGAKGSLDGHFWNYIYKYKSEDILLQYGMYGTPYYGFGYCPASAVLDATWNDDKSLDIIFSFKDEVVVYGNTNGTGNTMSIEWHGKADLYKGSEENLLRGADLGLN